MKRMSRKSTASRFACVSIIGNGPEHFAKGIGSNLDKGSKATAITDRLK